MVYFVPENLNLASIGTRYAVAARLRRVLILYFPTYIVYVLVRIEFVVVVSLRRN